MIRITGDISLTEGFFDLGAGVGTSIESGKDPFSKIQKRKGDIWIGNFEGVTSDTSELKGYKAEMFRIAPKFLKNIFHFNYYCVANNHIMQHGSSAYRETLKNIKSFGSDYFGDIDKKSILFEYKSSKISITSFSLRKEEHFKPPLYWHSPEYVDIEKEYQKIKDADFKIVYLHWGNEYMNYPYPDQEKFAHWLIDLGFDLIIGLHPHVLQGYEVYKGKYIYYSIGNFVFNMKNSITCYGAIVNVERDEKEFRVSHSYIKIENDYFPIEVSAEEIPYKVQFDYLNTLYGRDVLHETYYMQDISRIRHNRLISRFYFIKNIFKLRFDVLLFLLKDFIVRRKIFRK